MVVSAAIGCVWGAHTVGGALATDALGWHGRLLEGVVASILSPLSACLVALLYFRLREMKEGTDVVKLATVFE
jgi:hypothetical protein